MNKITAQIAFVSILVFSASTIVGDTTALEELAATYFDAKVATQQPVATPEDLEAYLALLTDDIGYEHKPYR